MINLKNNIPIFIKRKLLEHNLSLKELSLKSSIPYPTLKSLNSGNKSSPQLQTILKIAALFNCSIDEVLGRDFKHYYNKNFKYGTLEINQAINNLKSFIKYKIIENNLTLSRLSLNVGFSDKLLADFFKSEDCVKTLSTLAICGIADYFNASIDEMIGRVSYNPKEFDDRTNNNYPIT
ncbi:Helix-turn-helix protein (plasmid) [Rickettsiales bacterium Ac37b]|nr:Helix-turn-helix protein [Rickettsiales bacterium Ac37b]